MSSVRETLHNVRSLVAEFKHHDAERILLSELKQHPNDPNLNAELAHLYCFTQREFQATELLDKAKGGEKFDETIRILSNYFYCRGLLAKRAGTSDSKADQPRKRLAPFAVEPEEGIGIKLSACLIVKNEEAHLERCLSSIKDVVDEIVVVDTGSKNRTVEIAESFGAVIGHFDWCDDFAAARNESLRLATGNWALWIDADEVLTADSKNSVLEALIRPQFGGYFIKIVNFMDEEGEVNQYVHTPVRVFRLMPGMEFSGRIHEQVLPAFETLNLLPATLSNARINHYGYRQSTMREKDKINRTIGMLEKEVREHPRDPFHWFNLANAYSVARRAADAERAARLSVAFLEPHAPYGPVVYQILSSALIAQGRVEEALQVCDDAELTGFNSVLNEFDRAHALLKSQRPEDGLIAIDRALEMEWPSDLTGDYGIKTHKGKVLKAQLLTQAGKLNEALKNVNEALAVDPAFGIGIYAKAVILDQKGQKDEALKLYLVAGQTDGIEVACSLAAKCAYELGQYERAAEMFEKIWHGRPDDADAWIGWVQACEAVGAGSSLLRAYEEMSERQQLDTHVLVNWGRALQAVGNIEGALSRYLEAIERDPSNSNAFYNCGDLLYAMERYQEAAEVYEAGLRHDPVNPQAWFVLGNCFAQLDHTGGAVIAYAQALQIDPEHRGARANLATIQESLQPAA